MGIADIPVIDNKQEIIDAAHHRVEEINKAFRRGLMTEDDRYVAVTTTWREAKDALEKRLIETQDPKNPIVMMMDSGARGNISNFSQLAGMRGLMAAPNGRIMELPILSNFREGLSVLEMFFSTHGARKGMTDTALKTADSGYLTRRLVDVAQDVIIREDDCGTDRGLVIRAITDGKEVTETLEERLFGRYTKKSVKHPETGEVIVGPDTLITEDMAAAIVNAGVEEVTIRSVFTCKTRHGVCRHCYGINLATGDAVEVGEAVGTIAAQSIGEPGTQLTMRTFHTGGVASNTDITQGLPRIQEIFEARNPKGEAVITEVKGTVIEIEEDAATRTKKVFVQGKTGMGEYVVRFTARMKVEVGDEVHRGEALTEGSIQPKRLLEVRDTLSVETYLLAEVQKVYRSQGVEIGDKHVEVMVRQMLRKIRVMDPACIHISFQVHLWIFLTSQMLTRILLSLVVFLQHLVQSFLVLLKPHLKQIHSYQRLPSKKRHVCLQMQLSVVRKMILLVLKKMLSLVRLSLLVQVWLATVTLNLLQLTKLKLLKTLLLMKQLWNHLKTKTKTKELTNVGSLCIYIIKNASILAICET